MLARSRHITLRNAVEFSTPLLIPSLSSGALGLMLFQDSPKKTPEMTPCSIVHSRTLIGGIEESLLISAYDIKYGLLEDMDAFRSGFRNSRYAQPRVLVIDSGWYEKIDSLVKTRFEEAQRFSTSERYHMLGQYTEQRLYIVPRPGYVCSNSTCADFLRENQDWKPSGKPICRRCRRAAALGKSGLCICYRWLGRRCLSYSS